MFKQSLISETTARTHDVIIDGVLPIVQYPSSVITQLPTNKSTKNADVFFCTDKSAIAREFNWRQI